MWRSRDKARLAVLRSAIGQRVLFVAFRLCCVLFLFHIFWDWKYGGWKGVVTYFGIFRDVRGNERQWKDIWNLWFVICNWGRGMRGGFENLTIRQFDNGVVIFGVALSYSGSFMGEFMVYRLQFTVGVSTWIRDSRHYSSGRASSVAGHTGLFTSSQWREKEVYSLQFRGLSAGYY